MFKKLRESETRHTPLREKPTYTQKSINRARLKEASYSRLHHNRRVSPSNSLDYLLVSNDSYVYQGQWQGACKHGEGIAFLKNGCMVVGHWEKDRLNGRSLIFTPFGAMVSAHFIDDKLNGWVLAQYSSKLIIANLYFEDKIDGSRVVFEGSEGLWVASRLTQEGEFLEIINVENGGRYRLPAFVQHDELAQLFEFMVVDKNYAFDFKKIRCVEVLPSIRYIGYLDQQSQPSGLGVTYSDSQCFFGNFHDGFLEELGRMIFANGDVYHGGLSNGAFYNYGVYYNSKKNMTSVIFTHDDRESEINEEQKGYYLIDFQFKIGDKISKEDKIMLSPSTNKFMKILEKHYQQYFIDQRKSENEQNSNVSVEDKEEPQNLRINEIDEESEVNAARRKGSLTKWFIGNDQQRGHSEEASEPGQMSAGFELRALSKDQSIPKLRKNEFFSISIKQNEEPQQKQKYAKHSPKAINPKAKMFSNPQSIMESKSLDINELTFRGSGDRKGEPSSYRQQQYDSQEQFLESSRALRSRAVESNEVRSSQTSSKVSHIDDKLRGFMKKSTMRRRIFD